MSDKCQMVVFSNKAYNAIIRESFDKDPVETGGILLGHILDNGVWIVMEVLPPGIKCIFERAYFEYDDAFVNYLAQSVANQYKIPLELLGLWHRHPGSMDFFSSTDDGTNTTFASQNPSGVISGLVNIDPRFRLTMYHMANPRNEVCQYNRPYYERVDVEVGDDIIPDEYFQLKYYDGDSCNLNPTVERINTRIPRSVNTERARTLEPDNFGATNSIEPEEGTTSWINDIMNLWHILKRNKAIGVIVLLLIISSVFSIKIAIENCKEGVDAIISWIQDKKNQPFIIDDKVTLNVGGDITLEVENITKRSKVNWVSSDTTIAIVNKGGKVVANKEGHVEIALIVNGKKVDQCRIKIKEYELSANKMALKIGEKESLILSGVDDTSEIKWNTDDDSIVVYADGKVEGVGIGKTNIKAIVNNRIYTCKVSVFPENGLVLDIKPEEKNISISNKSYFVSFDTIEDVDIDGELIEFKSSKPKVATIDNKGNVILCKTGVTTITLLYNGKKQDTLNLNITK